MPGILRVIGPSLGKESAEREAQIHNKHVKRHVNSLTTHKFTREKCKLEQ